LKGVISDVWSLYADSQIFCIPSRFEGFGLVTVEAMMMGLPAVGFKECEGTNRIITDEAGILVDNMTATELARALKNLIQNQSFRLSLSNNTHEAIKEFNKETIIPKWVNLIG